KRIQELEKKMLNAEKKKFEAQQRQIIKIREALFPLGVLQERVDNLMPYYSEYGRRFLEMVYQYSIGLKNEFCIVEES
ncbi:MAG: bacillithiol biosynthesis BshC, partial [Ferruginibacter sp.]